MNKSELVACIYKHVGRTDDLENLTELAEEITKMAADEEREACAMICQENSARWDKIGGDGGASLECADSIRMRSNGAELRGSPDGLGHAEGVGETMSGAQPRSGAHSNAGLDGARAGQPK